MTDNILEFCGRSAKPRTHTFIDQVDDEDGAPRRQNRSHGPNMHTLLFRSLKLILESDETDLVRDARFDMDKAEKKLKEGRTPRVQRSPTGPNEIDRRTERRSRRPDEMAGSDTAPRLGEVRQKAPTRLGLGIVGCPGKGTTATSIARYPRGTAVKRRRRSHRKRNRQRLAAHARRLRR